MTADSESPQPPRPPRRKGDEINPIDAHYVLARVLWPGFIGMIGSVILGIGLPSILDSFYAQHKFQQMGQQFIARINQEFTALLSFDLSNSNFLLVLLFGFILGVLIRYTYGNDRVR